MEVFRMGDEVNCKHYGLGVVVEKELPMVGEEIGQILAEEKATKGKVITTKNIKVRLEYCNIEMTYNRQGYRLGVKNKPDNEATLEKRRCKI